MKYPINIMGRTINEGDVVEFLRFNNIAFYSAPAVWRAFVDLQKQHTHNEVGLILYGFAVLIDGIYRYFILEGDSAIQKNSGASVEGFVHNKERITQLANGEIESLGTIHSHPFTSVTRYPMPSATDLQPPSDPESLLARGPILIVASGLLEHGNATYFTAHMRYYPPTLLKDAFPWEHIEAELTIKVDEEVALEVNNISIVAKRTLNDELKKLYNTSYASKWWNTSWTTPRPESSKPNNPYWGSKEWKPGSYGARLWHRFANKYKDLKRMVIEFPEELFDLEELIGDKLSNLVKHTQLEIEGSRLKLNHATYLDCREEVSDVSTTQDVADGFTQALYTDCAADFVILARVHLPIIKADDLLSMTFSEITELFSSNTFPNVVIDVPLLVNGKLEGDQNNPVIVVSDLWIPSDVIAYYEYLTMLYDSESAYYEDDDEDDTLSKILDYKQTGSGLKGL